jgi:hypothetical protein
VRACLAARAAPAVPWCVWVPTQVDVPEYIPASRIEPEQDDEYFLLWRKATIVGRPPLALGLNAA